MAFLTIAEAIEKHGKSDSSYRRLIREIRKSGDARKRQHIKPSEKEIEEFRQKGQPYTYTIAEALLEQETQATATGHEQASEPKPATAAIDLQMIDALIAKMDERHDKEVARLERQLKEERDAAAAREARIQKYAEKDKERFAKASENMTQALATAKSLTQNLMIPVGTNSAADQNKSDVIPGTSRPKQGSATEAANPKKTKPAKKKTQQSSETVSRSKPRGVWKRFFGR